eukprot:TRINITY_DN5398_c0_g2_i1.p1 TRINITY_DN5398_c0_g2~~TRINITY_DN5398_c0_g2_i1.p1  ORF type:complete len:247 (-),score=89.82 TRINITY_DN5398_c0_g2_i1:45-785(-)
MVHRTNKDKKRNESEIMCLRKCQHPNIVTLYEAYDLLTEAWLIMENLNGGTLQNVVEKIDLAENEIAYIVRNTLEGLAHIHSKHIVHRDVKGANIMMSVCGDVKLIDFGVSYDLSVGGKVKIAGSPQWMAPEIIKRQPPTVKSDIWSLGITILEMTNHGPPNKDSPIKAMLAIVSGEKWNFSDPSKWSADLSDFLGLCLQGNPDCRPSALELLEHPWIHTACSRTAIERTVERVFLRNDLNHTGLL